MSKPRADLLTDAISLTDLPALVAERYPDSGAKPGKADVVFARWRGNENTPAFSLSKVKGRWLWKDHATGEGGNAFDWLTMTEGMGAQEAATFLVDRAGLGSGASQERREAPSEDSPAARYHPLPPKAVEALTALPPGTVAAMKGRGFTTSLLKRYNIRADGDDALIPITSPEGVVMQVKRRLHGVDGTGKYRYEHKGHGGPAWCSPGSRQASIILIVEGELNAIIAHAALGEQADIGVMGMAGASSPLYPGVVGGKTVLVYADDDPAGEKARAAWSEAAHEQGASSVHVIPAHSLDFCDVAGKHGIPILTDMLDAMRHAAKQVYGASDRLVGGETEAEVMERLLTRLDGGIMHPTGFHDVDRDIGGIREAGLYNVGGLPSMGKSATLRRIWLEHVRGGGKVRVYSPDQAKDAIHRLYAAQLSGVSFDEVRKGEYSPGALRIHGSPEAAKQAFIDTFRDVFRYVLPNLQISSETSMRKIASDMRRAVDEGVTMFGVDYLQMIVSSQGVEDGLQADEMQSLAMELKVPVVCGLQLAKYKFPTNRVSGVPLPTDIEGSGAYFQSSEILFMIYNEGIYRAKYGGDGYQGLNDPPNMARLLLTKDKEGGGNAEWPVRWWPRLATYTDYIAGTPTYDVKRERKGLLPT